jgi:hypothetical protein
MTRFGGVARGVPILDAQQGSLDFAVAHAIRPQARIRRSFGMPRPLCRQDADTRMAPLATCVRVASPETVGLSGNPGLNVRAMAEERERLGVSISYRNSVL